VITTRYNGAAECLTDGREGYVVDSPTDVDALADRVVRLSDLAHRHQCALAAPSAVQRFTMARHAAEVVRLYNDILDAAKCGEVGRETGKRGLVAR